MNLFILVGCRDCDEKIPVPIVLRGGRDWDDGHVEVYTGDLGRKGWEVVRGYGEDPEAVCPKCQEST